MNLPRRIEDYVIVTLITVLLWMFAEAQDVRTYTPDAPLPIAITAAAPDLAVINPSHSRVAVDFRGTAGEISRLRAKLASGLKVELTGLEPGRHTLPLAKLLPDAEPLDTVRASLTRIEPETMEVTVIQLRTVEAELIFKPEGVKLVEDRYKLIPQRVSLTAPQDKLDAIRNADGQYVLSVVPPGATNLSALPAGVEQNLRANVQLPDALQRDDNVTLAQKTVDLAFTIDRKDNSVDLPSVPIWPSMPTEQMREFKVTFDDNFLHDVRVSGPLDLVEQVRKGELRVIAIVALTREDLVKNADKEEFTRNVFFNAPLGLNVESPDATVKITITRLAPNP